MTGVGLGPTIDPTEENPYDTKASRRGPEVVTESPDMAERRAMLHPMRLRQHDCCNASVNALPLPRLPPAGRLLLYRDLIA